ncbi:helix-turn-helix domain-containing protein [Castellaniella hirudinis]|uniref:helix-turn-helix domain-containing protein n=1 Tax=Castellaniella hirudinis TaxID=1144617 RepID=UPI0039C1289D
MQETVLTEAQTQAQKSALAERLKALRLQRGLTQGQVTTASGISTPTLSKIENGQLSPTYDVLLRLAHGLGVDVAALFATTQSHMGAGRRSIERHDSGEIHDTPLYHHRLLFSQLANKAMMPFVTRIKKHHLHADEGWSRHEGEEFVFVLAGQIQLHTEFYQPVDLSRGEGFYIDSRMRHRVISLGDADAEVLWVSTTPDLGPKTQARPDPPLTPQEHHTP